MRNATFHFSSRNPKVEERGIGGQDDTEKLCGIIPKKLCMQLTIPLLPLVSGISLLQTQPSKNVGEII